MNYTVNLTLAEEPDGTDKATAVVSDGLSVLDFSVSSELFDTVLTLIAAETGGLEALASVLASL